VRANRRICQITRFFGWFVIDDFAVFLSGGGEFAYRGGVFEKTDNSKSPSQAKFSQRLLCMYTSFSSGFF